MIKVDDLSYTYPSGDNPTLHGLSFAIPEGEVFGFLGPSGSGKSTAQKLITGQIQPPADTVELLGRDFTAWGRELYNDIGVCFELPSFFLKLTGRENLDYFASLYPRLRSDRAEVIKLLGLEDALDQPVAEYSKGMMTRLGLIRALQHQPRLLFLDEPTSGLDPASSARVQDLIRRERSRGVTIFLTTHDMLTADALCDRLAFLIHGAISCVGSPRTLKQENGKDQVKVVYESDDGAEELLVDLKGLGQDARFQDVLRRRSILSIHSQEATLSEVFIRQTGVALE
ncbi:MAG: ABC transporter ATP-binding protein [Pseudomonadota bacterium]